MAQIASVLFNECNTKWMEDIKSVMVLDDRREVIFSFANSVYGDTKDEGVLSRFMLAMESFAREFGGNELKMVEVGSEKIYLLKDNFSGFLFIAVSHKHTKRKSIFKKLEKIRDMFNENCLEQLISKNLDKKALQMHFLDSLEKLDSNPSSVDNFLIAI